MDAVCQERPGRPQPSREERIEKTDAGAREPLPIRAEGERMKPVKKTRKTPGQSILTGVKQAIAWASGEDVPVRQTIVKLPQIDVKAVRRRMGQSQEEFAQKFGFARASVRNWEQGRRQAEGPAKILLAVIDRAPQTVEAVLRAHSRIRTNPKAQRKQLTGAARAKIAADLKGRRADFRSARLERTH